MNEAVMVGRIKETSPRFMARMAGVFYLSWEAHPTTLVRLPWSSRRHWHYCFSKLYSQGFGVCFVFFGFYCLLIGYLIFRSRFMPRFLGVGMAIAGLGGLTFLSPSLVHYLSPLILLGGIGEGALVVWLLVVGVRPERWKEQAGSAG